MSTSTSAPGGLSSRTGAFPWDGPELGADGGVTADHSWPQAWEG